LSASIQVELSSEVLGVFREDVLEMLRSSASPAVVLDVSGVEIIDLTEFSDLLKLIETIELMGARTIIAGFRPGVASSLVDLGADTLRLEVASDFEAALLALDRPRPATPDEFEDDWP
jgi:anti-anti-sigma regulatory factor